MTIIESPYSKLADSNWYTGNLHTHTTVSDGPCGVPQTISAYAGLGHDFLALSDHDVLVEPDEYGTDLGIETVQAVEVSANGPHLLHVGATEAIEPLADRRVVAERASAEGEVAIAAHPGWGDTYEHWSYDSLRESRSLDGLEIYNAHIETLKGSATAVDVWDRLLTEGRRIWGFANDDTHSASRMGLAYNVVAVQEPSVAGIIEGLSAGRFYASTGVWIESIEVDGDTVRVQTGNAETIRFLTDHGVVQSSVEGPTARIRIPESLPYGSEHTYLRIECFGRGESRAWSQPLFLGDS